MLLPLRRSCGLSMMARLSGKVPVTATEFSSPSFMTIRCRCGRLGESCASRRNTLGPLCYVLDHRAWLAQREPLEILLLRRRGWTMGGASLHHMEWTPHLASGTHPQTAREGTRVSRWEGDPDCFYGNLLCTLSQCEGRGTSARSSGKTGRKAGWKTRSEFSHHRH